LRMNDQFASDVRRIAALRRTRMRDGRHHQPMPWPRAANALPRDCVSRAAATE
jgi:hypothetical protein